MNNLGKQVLTGELAATLWAPIHDDSPPRIQAQILINVFDLVEAEVYETVWMLIENLGVNER